MCGLVGLYSSNFLMKHKEVLSDLLFLDTFRGRDSTGVAAIRNNADTEVLKRTVPGPDFIDSPEFGQHLKVTDFCWIGHNRYGTVGKNTKTNAHPFMIEDEDGCCLIVGAHNGTLTSKHKLPDHAKFGTDSEALYNSIAHEGLEKTLKELEGAWALTWYDHIEEELRFLRNDKRTLFYAWEEGRKTIIWASEDWMIRVATSRHGIKLEDNKVWSVNEDTLYRFPVPLKINETITVEKKGGFVGKETTTFFRHPTGGQAPAHQKTTETTQTTNQGAKTSCQTVNQSQSGMKNNNAGGPQPTTSGHSSSTRSSGNVHDITSAKKYRGFKGVLLSKKEIEEQLVDGCAWCEEEALDTTSCIAWMADSKPLCYKCRAGVPKPEDSANTNKTLVH